MTRIVKEECKSKVLKQLIMGEQINPEYYIEVKDTPIQQSEVTPEPFAYDFNKIIEVVPIPEKNQG